MDKQIKPSIYNDLITEVLDFIESGKLLNSVNQINLDNTVITDIEIAKDLAWNGLYGKQEYTWANLRSEKMSELWGIIYESDDKYADIDIKLSSTVAEMSDVILKQLDQPHKELLDDIVSDLKGCLYSRAVQGKNNKFFEIILSTYLKGDWPCGWEGDWPDGDVITYKKLLKI